MNFKQLEAFLLVTDLQSFTKAARQLYMSQPAVSFQIKSLEEDLQVALFQRGDKKIILTEAGRFLYPEVKKILKHYNEIRNGLEELKGLKTGSIIVGASTIPGEYLLPLLIGGFKEEYPGIQVALKVAGSGQVIRWVREREIDLGIIGVPVSYDHIKCLPWLHDNMVLIVHPEHPWSNITSVNINDMQKETMIMREQGSGTRLTLEKKFEEKGLSLARIPHKMEMGSTRAVITAVEAGLGIGIVSKCAVADALELERVKEVVLSDLDLKRSFYIIRYKDLLGGFTVDAFSNFIDNHELCHKYLKK